MTKALKAKPRTPPVQRPEVDRLIEERWSNAIKDVLTRAGPDVHKRLEAVRAYANMLRGVDPVFVRGARLLRDVVDPGASLAKAIEEAKVRYVHFLFAGVTDLALQLEGKWDRLRETNRVNASKPRADDALGRLIARTELSLNNAGKRATPMTVIQSLGKHDDDSILAARPAAPQLYGKDPDPKRTYWDAAEKNVWWRDSSGSIRSTSRDAIRIRLQRRKQRNR